MKIKLDIETWLFSIILFYPLLHAMIRLIGGDAVNRFVIFTTLLYIIYYCRKIGSKNIDQFIVVIIIFLVDFLYSLLNWGVIQVVHSDYYSLVLTMFIFLTISDETTRIRYRSFFEKHQSYYQLSTILFIFIIFLSILFGNGVHSLYGSTTQYLYGPYSAPQELGYSFLGIYCGTVMLENKSKIYVNLIKCICVICIIWTGARSTFIALVILICVDFIYIKKFSKKVILISMGICVLVYLLLFTDIIYTNPLVKKTIDAYKQGSITNGRERFNRILLFYYTNHMSLLRKMFGVGMLNVRNVMRMDKTVGVAIHAHNDYINVLVSHGCVGMVLFVLLQLKLFFSYRKKKTIFLLEVVLTVLAYYNGLTMYSVFTPILMILCLFFGREDGVLVNSDIS